MAISSQFCISLLLLIPALIDSLSVDNHHRSTSLRVAKSRNINAKENNSTPIDDLSHAVPNLSPADFVIVGAGTAGSLLAERLSEIGSVLILECGTEVPNSVRSRLPGAGCTYDQLQTEIGLYTNQKFCGERCWVGMAQSAGFRQNSGLDFRFGPGGTSVLAVGGHFRGGDEYWNEIAKSHGGHWVLPEEKLMKLEHEMSVRKVPAAVDEDHVLFSQAVSNSAAGEHRVFPRYQDESGWSTNSYTQFFKKAIKKENVRVVNDACAQRLTKGDDKKVPAVELQYHHQKYQVRAKKEVIVAAGALGSPALLQRSGLTTAPVRDQALIRMAWPCSNCKYRKEFLKALQTFFQEDARTSPPGALTLPGYDSGTFLDLGGAPALIMASTAVGKSVSNMLPVVEKEQEGSMLIVHIVLLQPHSFEGSVTSSGEFELSPRLTHSKDLDAAVHGIDLVRKVIKEQAALGKLGLGEEVFPGVKHQSNSDLREFLQSPHSDAIALFQSATASCRLGQVVDGEMSVIGMPNVRVADASVLPKPPLGRTLFPTLVVAEVASGLIAKDAS